MPAVEIILAPGSLSLLVVALMIGAAAMWRGPRVARAGRVWVAAWAVAYLFLSLPVVALALRTGLLVSQSFDSTEGEAQPDVIVVLSGGALRHGAGGEAFAVMTAATTQRVLEAARVYRLAGAPVVVASGAGAESDPGADVVVMRAALTAAGVPEGRIEVDAGSADTRQSAVSVRRLMQARGLSQAVLVTSDQHMKRALQAFESAGVHAIPAPARSIATARDLGWRGLIPDARALDLSERCLHEYVGVIYYRLRGWN